MKKNIIIIFLIFLICGCKNNNYDNLNTVERDNNNFNENKLMINEVNPQSIHKKTTQVYEKINISCPVIDKIFDIKDNVFVTIDGELYEYSNEIYSLTNNNCMKIDSDVIFSKFLYDRLLYNDKGYYSYSNRKLIKDNTNIIPNELTKNHSFKEKDITLIPNVGEWIYYILLNDRIYQYDEYKNDFEFNNSEIIFSIPTDEKIEYFLDGVIKTNKSYYNFIIEEQQSSECEKYADIDCDITPTFTKTSILNSEINFYENVTFYKPGEIIIFKNGDIYRRVY